MVSITLSIPEELKQDMDSFPEINWSAVAREAIRNRLLMMKKFREFTMESIMTENDALVLGEKTSKGLAKRYQNKR